METRKITIVSTKTQKKYVIESDATTLGELKEALSANNIDYSDMTFYEGLSKTELNHNESILPHDIERNGQTTNELVFMLTNMNKKIKSGALSEVREALYAEIKNNGWQDLVVSTFGKNFTQVSTADLANFVENMTPQTTCECGCTGIEEAFKELCSVLYDDDILSDCEYENILSKLPKKEEVDKSPYTDKEICKMFSHLME